MFNLTNLYASFDNQHVPDPV